MSNGFELCEDNSQNSLLNEVKVFQSMSELVSEIEEHFDYRNTSTIRQDKDNG